MSFGGCIDKLIVYIHSVGYYSAINKGRNICIHAVKWMNLKCRTLNKRSRSHDYILYGSMYVAFWKRQITGTENRSVFGRSQGEVEGLTGKRV